MADVAWTDSDVLFHDWDVLWTNHVTIYADIQPLMHRDLIDPYSPGAWMWLCQIIIPGYDTIFLARNTEDVTYAENTYAKSNIEIDKQSFSGEGNIPRLLMRIAQDPDGSLENIVNATKGAHQGLVKLMRVHENYLDYEIKALETFYQILVGDSDWQWIYFTLGIPNPLTQQLPLRVGSSKVCPWAQPEFFKGARCQYAGSDTSCIGTIKDCRNKGNGVHWGGELGLDPNVARI